ncbi:hypothetical protein WDJ51_12120 [Rathayibacter sp. YIM 133350]|uniref:DUF7507 domain-containing protein n=1 Tax=Rathayibacter sp. YIM 133350 TaxID=3131992 RepID=UPI00307D761B
MLVVALAIGAIGVAVVEPPSPASADPPTGGTTVVAESFEGSSVADPNWVALNDACLTGANGAPPAGSANFPDCSTHRNGAVPPLAVTPGYLQLTDNGGFTRGAALYNLPIQATAGVSITFEQYQYGGSGADGIGFFLVDGSTNLNETGADGGSLGYAQRNLSPGIEGGYIGVGLDSYGNYWDDGENRGNGCPATQKSPTTSNGPIAPNVIAVRGPGRGIVGYCLIGATVPTPVTNPQHPGTTLNASRGTLRGADIADSKRTVNVQVTPVSGANPIPRIIVQVQYTDGGPWVEELNILAPPEVPSTYKFGIMSSTGGSTDVHLVRAARISTIDPLPELQLAKQVDRTEATLPAVISAGTQIPYQYTVTNAGTVPVSALAIADDRIPAIACDSTTLAPAPAIGSTTVCRGSYTVTSADVAAGSVTNVATASAYDSGGGRVVSPQANVTVPLVSALSLTKAASTPAPYAIGQQVGYQYGITNTGSSTLSTVAVTDDRIPTSAITCDRTTLLPQQTATCTGSAVIRTQDLTTAGYLVNTATASAVTPIGQSVVSPPASFSIPVATDVGIVKTAANPAPDVGANETYTIVATNYGPSPATNVQVSDPVPSLAGGSRLQYVSSAPPAGTTYAPATGLWTIPSLAVSQSVTLQVVAKVNSSAPTTNTAAVVHVDQLDINPVNDLASVTLSPFTPTADLAVTKTVVGDTTVAYRTDSAFRVTVRNLGPRDATGVRLFDALPPSLVYDAAASSGDGTYDPVSGVWTVGSVPVGGTASFTIGVQTTQVGTFTNLAILAPTSSPPDNNATNNASSATLTVRPVLTDLSIVKNVFPQTATVGDVVTYQVDATNLGPETAYDVYAIDNTPPGVQILTSQISQGTADAANSRWDIGTLEPGGLAHATFTARVIAPGSQTNTATIDALNQQDTDPSKNVSSATVTGVEPPLDIAVTKSIVDSGGYAPTAVPIGVPLTFELTATNNQSGPDPTAATGLSLLDALPTGLQFVSQSGQGTYDPATGVWTVGALASGQSATIRLTEVGVAPSSTTNSVSLFTVGETDTNPSNNLASVPFGIIRLNDIRVLKSVDHLIARPGQEVVYNITVTNAGPNDAEDVTGFDAAGTDPRILDVIAPAGTSFDRSTGVWTIGDLANGASVTLEVHARVNAESGFFRNTASVRSGLWPDPDITNNVASVDLTVPSADIDVRASVDKPVSYVGDTVTFTIDVSNRFSDPSGLLLVAAPLPSGLELISATPTAGTYNAATGIWTLPNGLLPIDLDPAHPDVGAVLTVVARVTAEGTITSSASSDRSASTPYDPNLANNSSSATIVAGPAPAALSLTKQALPSAVAQGGAGSFRLTIANAGPGAATNVVLSDPLPSGLSIVSVSDPACVVAGSTLNCAFPSIAANADPVQIDVEVLATAVGALVNTASVEWQNPLSPGVISASADLVVTPVPPVPPTPSAPTDRASGSLSASGYQGEPAILVAVVLLILGACTLSVRAHRPPRRRAR